MAASTHGAFFAATGGKHLTSNDVFKQAELIKRKESIAKMEKVKNFVKLWFLWLKNQH